VAEITCIIDGSPATAVLVHDFSNPVPIGGLCSEHNRCSIADCTEQPVMMSEQPWCLTHLAELPDEEVPEGPAVVPVYEGPVPPDAVFLYP
jgi:hypothetical protein